ncbi:hypothetical protein [Aureimonas sp. AU4]|uniref:hypothetical protein n=1 Tax=Aureimonas sp. AU4 TaxID=1638163 RepID=UPI0012E3B5CE|nr:hypothetical protein [Aureimonas sp. AU4]
MIDPHVPQLGPTSFVGRYGSRGAVDSQNTRILLRRASSDRGATDVLLADFPLTTQQFRKAR